MKPSKKTKPAQSENQLTLDTLVEAVHAVAQKIDQLITKQTPNPHWVDAEGNVAPIIFKRPTLKWVEQKPQPIRWAINVDPATLILTPGTTLRYDKVFGRVTTYDGVQIGNIDHAGQVLIRKGLDSNAKLHVYLTTDRRLGIKLGRPQ